MKNLKKMMGIALVLIMTLAMTIPAFAANININVTTPEGASDTGETYSVYKIFDATVAKETADQTGTEPDGTVSIFENVSYYIESTSPFYDIIKDFEDEGQKVFELNLVAGSATRYNVTLAEGVESYSAAALATELQTVINQATPVASGKSPLKVDNKGYYMILSSLGSMAVVDTVGQSDMTIQTKNDLPTLNKTIESITNGTVDHSDDKSGTASYGSTVTFKITVDVPASAVGAITVHDEMDDAFAYVALADATTEGVTETAAPADACTKEFVIPASVVAAAVAGDTDVEVVYTATLNEKVDTATDFNNTAYLTYSNYTSASSVAKVQTYKFDLVKTNSDEMGKELLNGAEFKLYREATGGTPIQFELVDGVYNVTASGTDTIVVTDGKINVKGLADGKYYLEETKSPEGYNPLKDRQEMEIAGADLTASVTEGAEGAADTYVSGGVRVVNLTGAELPSTGGIGTTIFYVVGGLLVVGAGIALTVRKRVNDQE